MADAVEIVLGATDQPWAHELGRWIADHGGGVRLRDTYALHRADVLEDRYDCLVIDADHSLLLDHDLVQQLHRRSRTVVGVYDASDRGARAQLERCGVDPIVERSTPPAEIVRVVLTAARHHEEFDRRTAAGAAGPDDERYAAPWDSLAERPRLSCVTVVTGPAEGVGATEVAVELAAQLRGRGESVVLVDADLVAPSLSQRLRVDYDPNINTAVDAVRRLSGHLSDALIPVHSLGVHLLGGLEHPKNWADLLPDEITDVLTGLRPLRSHVVVNVGSCLEELGYDTPGRHSVARAVVTAADVVVVVADPSPIGIRRLSKWTVDVTELTDPARVHAAFNRSSASADYRREVDAETRRSLGIGGVSHLPYDGRVARAYLALEPVAAGPFTKAVAALAETAVPHTTRPIAPRRRRWTRSSR